MEVSGGGEELSPAVEKTPSSTAMEVNAGEEKLIPAVEKSTVPCSAMEVSAEEDIYSYTVSFNYTVKTFGSYILC